MPKQNEAYRGEDQTLEKIRAQYTHLLVEAGEIPDDQEIKDKLWDLACEHVYVEFVKEGLMTTANEVLKHTTASFKIIKTGVIGHTGPEAVMPPRDMAVDRAEDGFDRTVQQVVAGYDKDGEPEFVEYQTISGEPL